MKSTTARLLYRRLVASAVGLARVLHPFAPPERQFNHAWAILSGRTCTTRLADLCADDFRRLPGELLLSELIKQLDTRRRPYLPRIVPGSAQDAEALQSVRAGSIVLSVHAGYPSSTELLLRAGLPVTLLSLAPRNRLRKRYPHLQVVPGGPLSLARIRHALLEGRVVSCTADHRQANQGEYYLVELGIFEFARRMQAPLHFTANDVSPCGAFVKRVSPPHHVRDALESANAFIDFFNAQRQIPKRLIPVTLYD